MTKDQVLKIKEWLISAYENGTKSPELSQDIEELRNFSLEEVKCNLQQEVDMSNEGNKKILARLKRVYSTLKEKGITLQETEQGLQASLVELLGLNFEDASAGAIMAQQGSTGEEDKRPEAAASVARDTILEIQTIGVQQQMSEVSVTQEILEKAGIRSEQQGPLQVANYMKYGNALLERLKDVALGIDRNEIIQFLRSVEKIRKKLSDRWAAETDGLFDAQDAYRKKAQEGYPIFFEEQFSSANFQAFLVADIVEICKRFYNLSDSGVTWFTELASNMFLSFKGDEDALLGYFLNPANLQRSDILQPSQKTKEKLLEAKIRVIINDSSREQFLKLLQGSNIEDISVFQLRQIENKRIEISEAIDVARHLHAVSNFLKQQLFNELYRRFLLTRKVDDIDVEKFISGTLGRLNRDIHFKIDLLCYERASIGKLGALGGISPKARENYHEILGQVTERDFPKLEGYMVKIEQIRQRCINRISKECSKIATEASNPQMKEPNVYSHYISQKFYPRFIKMLQDAVEKGEIDQAKIEDELMSLISELIKEAQSLTIEEYKKVGMPDTGIFIDHGEGFGLGVGLVRAARGGLGLIDDTEVLMSATEKEAFAGKLYQVCQNALEGLIETAEGKASFEEKFNALRDEYLITCDMAEFIFKSYNVIKEIMKLEPEAQQRARESQFDDSLKLIAQKNLARVIYKIKRFKSMQEQPENRPPLGKQLPLTAPPLTAPPQPAPPTVVGQSAQPQPAPPSADSPIIEVVIMPQRPQDSALPQGEANTQKLKQEQVKDKLHFRNRLVATIALGVATVGCVIGAGVLIAVTGGIAAAPLIPLVALVCSAGAGLLATIRAGMNTARTRSTISHNQKSLEEAQQRGAEQMQQTPQLDAQMQQTQQPAVRPNLQPVDLRDPNASFKPPGLGIS